MRITVITVCYNSEETIERTIKSVIAQNYSNLEYIIIDGASTDRTLAIIEKYKDNISFYSSEPDNGIYDAMNKGLERATGDIFAFLNSDDWYAENVLEMVNKYFETSEADMVSGNMYLYSHGDGKELFFDKKNRDKMFFEVIYPHPALFARRDLYLKYGGFDTAYRLAADTDWVMKVCLDGAKVVCADEYFTYFSDSGASFKKRYAGLKEQYQIALKYAERDEYKHMRAEIQDFYTVKLSQVEKWERQRNALEKRTEDVKKLFDQSQKYYIWGTGIRGMECLEIFERLGLQIVGFIDSNKKEGEINVYHVYAPTEIDTRNNICITPKGYEEEIISALRHMHVNPEQYFTYSDMIDRIVSFGRIEEE